MPRAVLYFTGEALENDDDVSIVWEREKKTFWIERMVLKIYLVN